MDEKRIGIFVCHCGRNIGESIDIKKVIKEMSEYPGVVHTEDYKYMCSDPGQLKIKSAIKEKFLNSVVVAACTPTLHQFTFRKTVQSQGLNPYLCESANIREQCSWVHQRDKEKATRKAIKIIKGMVEKVKFNESLTPISIPINKKALVVGGGIAGMQVALDIADGGYEVILVEKEPSIGGHMAQLSETFPTLDCAQCIMTPKMVDIRQHPNIKLYTYSEIEELSGYVGNFKVKIKRKARSVDEEKCTGCGDCWTNCLIRNCPEIQEMPSIKEKVEPIMVQKLDQIIDKYESKKENIIGMLQAINQEYNWLPRDAIYYIAERIEVPFSYVYRIASFFTQFSLKPRGKYIIKICLGTACFVRGAPSILSKIESDLGIKPNETTEDGLFTLETVNCLGACALGPLIVINEDYYGKVKPTKLPSILKTYSQ